jgi:hypothetical protein
VHSTRVARDAQCAACFRPASHRVLVGLRAGSCVDRHRLCFLPLFLGRLCRSSPRTPTHIQCACVPACPAYPPSIRPHPHTLWHVWGFVFELAIGLEHYVHVIARGSSKWVPEFGWEKWFQTGFKVVSRWLRSGGAKFRASRRVRSKFEATSKPL